MTDPSTRHLILGVAGHIDHGKTSLVRRLTGIDTDRLPEEKKRGITIDLGFANLDLPGVSLGVIDVPGHERFVHNMVAGATGIDLAMLVVAADDSVMPQTIEHLAILKLLGVSRGLVAVTKIDLVERGHLELAIEEIRELLAETPLASSPIVPVSSVTGEGLETLEEQLGNVARDFRRPVRRQIFRLPIDRVFTVQGHGAVVTGTALSGQANVGDTLALMPQGRAVRIRRLQSHGHDVDSVSAGQRGAINLANVKADEIHRGDEIAVEGYLEPTRRILAQVEVLASMPRPLQHRQLVRLHLGTREVTARAIVRGEPIQPGGSGFVEFRAQDWLLADYGQRFIVRQLSPVVTLGGGSVLDPAISPRQRLRDFQEVAAKLAQSDPLERLAAYLEHHDLRQLTATALAARLGIDPAEKDRLLEQLIAQRRLVQLGGPNGLLIHKSRREALGAQIVVRCQRELNRRQPSRTLERPTIAAACRRLAEPAVLEVMIDDLLGRGQLVKIGDRIGPLGQRANLTRNQQKWQTQLIEMCKRDGLSPPVLADAAKQIGQPLKEIELLARVAAEDGLLVRVASNLYLDPEALEGMRKRTVDRLRDQGAATVSELRELWGVSRKYAVPFCEYFDTLGVTVRSGDTRAIGPNADQQPIGPKTDESQTRGNQLP